MIEPVDGAGGFLGEGLMRILTRAIVVSLILAGAIAFEVEAAEIRVLSAAGIKSVVDELGPQFERATGHKLVTKFVGGPAVQQAVAAGEAYDVAISQPAEIDKLLKDGKVASGTKTDIARSGMGVGVRKGAARPDISSAEAFKRALLSAQSIAYAGQGASGAFFGSLFDRLGIAAEMKDKLKSMPAGTPSAEAVARGEAEIVLLSVPSILAVPGVDLVGPLPPELQYYSGFAAGIVASTKEGEAARSLINFLTTPAAAPVIKAKGLEPGGG
jgi:molybdate transport system substrate-binding protein